MADHRTGDQRSAVAAAPAEHAIDVPWNIETGGIRPISESERHGKPSEMFWVWFAANMGITALPFGAYLVTFYSLNLTQAIFAAIIGCALSYALVGLVGIAGIRAGAPTMVVSRASFGVVGNKLPTLVSYATCIGFEILLMAIATLAFGSILSRAGLGGGDGTLAISFAIAAFITIAISLLGHATIVKMATIFTWIYGILIIPFMIFSSSQIDLHKVTTLPTGHFLGGFIGGISIVAVSRDSPDGLQRTFEQAKESTGFPFPIVSDFTLETFKAYRAFDDFEHTPLHGTFLIDGSGQVRWQNIDYQPFRDAQWLFGEAKRLLSAPAH